MNSAVEYQVVWDGTTRSASGSRYLSVDAGCEPPPSSLAPAPVDPPPIRFVELVRDALAARGPMTVRELADTLGTGILKTNSALCNLKKQAAVVVVDQVPIVVKAFGPRMRAVYGLASRLERTA